ncbi:MAG: ABC transporter ATP-binding protein [Clostridiales bacterium]|nr:ABC transporter ATP-binding protein [Clostridiales bacterium]
MSENKDILLSIRNLKTHFHVRKRVIRAVDGVSLDVRAGKTLGLVGESGCGKSITAHTILRLLPKTARIKDGEIIFHSRKRQPVDLLKLQPSGKEMRGIRGNDISMIFQDPMSSLNPVYRIGDQIVESILEHENTTRAEAMERALEMLKRLSIPSAEKRIREYPHQFSGGMKQRVMIAMGLICNPELLIADEPTTALDVTIQAQILELMQELQRQLGFTIILITHNMGIVADVADDVAVMYMGKIMEFGSKEDVFLRPSHPYTRALLKSVPVLGNSGRDLLEPIRGSTPDPSDLPEGCSFAPRCDFAKPECGQAIPYVDVGNGHLVRCVLAEGREVRDGQ